MSTQSLPSVDAVGLQSANELSSQQRVAGSEEEIFACWCGRCVTRSVETAACCIGAIFSGSMRFAAAAFEDSFVLSRILRKLDTHILALIEQFGSTPKDYFKPFSASLKSAMGALYFMQIAVSINYFVSGRYNKDSAKEIYGSICRAASNVGYSLLWLQEQGLNKIGNLVSGFSEVRLFSFVPKIVESIPPLRNTPQIQQAAASIGNLRALSFTSKITLNGFAKTAENIAYLFFVSQAIQDLIQAVKEGNSTKIKSSLLTGLYFASELAIEGLLLIGYTSVTGLGILAVTSVIFAVTNLSYEIFLSERSKKVQS